VIFLSISLSENRLMLTSRREATFKIPPYFLARFFAKKIALSSDFL
jgi:hypothetical protein